MVAMGPNPNRKGPTSRGPTSKGPTPKSGAAAASRSTEAAAAPSKQEEAEVRDMTDMVLEYLVHAGFDKSATVLKQQVRERRDGRSGSWRPVGRDVQDHVKSRMLKALDQGDRDEFLKLWENFVPPLVRRTDRSAQKLEFYLHIFFAIYPLHPSNPKPQPAAIPETMQAFKYYLETEGASLAVTPEFLAYYAMPYVPEISKHPSFKDLFSVNWAQALKARLSELLATTPQFAASPRLLEMYRTQTALAGGDPNGGGPGGGGPLVEAQHDLAALRQRLVDSELRAVETKQSGAAREAAMQRGAREGVELASELLQTLMRAGIFQQGSQQLFGLQSRLQAADQRAGGASRLEPALPPPQDDGGDYGYAPAVAGYQGLEAIGEGGESAASLGGTMTMMAALDFGGIKRELLERSDESPPLLQALRWRLTKPARRQRKMALAQYIQNDLLEPQVLATLLDPASPPQVREQALRLINLFASEVAGRSYLLAQPELVPQLCELLRQDERDTVARQNALGALQKLSLRRQPQNAMIDNDVIGWLVGVLRDADTLSQYSVEYGTALLMNLSLRSAGKVKCEEAELDILSVLSQLTESDSLQVRTYVNGTLYSILVRAALKERAQELGLSDSLGALIEHSDETFARQIRYILDQLAAPPVAEDEEAPSDNEEADEEAEEEEADDEEAEEEEEVDVFAEANLASDGAAGEELLAGKYLAGLGAAQHEAAQLEEDERRRAAAPPAADAIGSSSKRRLHNLDEPLQRPTTPGANAMNPQAAPEDVPKSSEYDLSAEAEAAAEAEFAAAKREKPAPGSEVKMDYPDADAPEFVEKQETFYKRERLPRTPQTKTRDLVPLPPASTRSERQRKPPPGSGGEPASAGPSGGTRKGAPGSPGTPAS